MTIDALPWLARLDLRDAGRAWSLRNLDLEAARDDRHLWIRGTDVDAVTLRALRSVSGLERFLLLPTGQLAEFDSRVPIAQLPDLEWCAVDAMLPVDLPRGQIAEREPKRLPLSIVRSSAELEAVAAILSIEALFRWIDGAPSARLQGLAFASERGESSEDQNGARALVISSRDRAPATADTKMARPLLPPLPTERYYSIGSILMPLGYRFDPDLGLTVLERVFDVHPDELLLVSKHETIERIPRSVFVPLSRSAVRSTRTALRRRAEGLEHE